MRHGLWFHCRVVKNSNGLKWRSLGFCTDSLFDGLLRSASRKSAGRALIVLASLGLAAIVLVQMLYATEVVAVGFSNWRPVLYAYLAWSLALGAGQVMMRGEDGHKALFVLPAVLFTVAMAIFPTVFGLYIAFTDWNLSAFAGRHFNGLDNLRALFGDAYFWNALLNMVFYVLAVLAQYAIAFGLALLLNADIKARKFFRVAFLMPFMLSPVAVSWMIGKSIMEYRLRPGRDLRPLHRLGQPGLLRLALDGPHLHHGDGRLGLDPLHHDPAARRAAGVAEGDSGSGPGRRPPMPGIPSGRSCSR